MRLVSQENKGLSVARNVGFQIATGEIIAYTDSDCVVDPDWLTYLAYKFVHAGFVAVGGRSEHMRACELHRAVSHPRYDEIIGHGICSAWKGSRGWEDFTVIGL